MTEQSTLKKECRVYHNAAWVENKLQRILNNVREIKESTLQASEDINYNDLRIITEAVIESLKDANRDAQILLESVTH